MSIYDESVNEAIAALCDVMAISMKRLTIVFQLKPLQDIKLIDFPLAVPTHLLDISFTLLFSFL